MVGGATIAARMPDMPNIPNIKDLEAGVLSEIDTFVRELRGSRALAAVVPEASLEKDLGLGSLERVELLSRLERRFGAKVSESVLGEAETPRDLAVAFLESEQEIAIETATACYRTTRRSLQALPADARSLQEVLVKRAQAEPDNTHLFLREDKGPERAVSLSELYSEALTLAGGLTDAGVSRGDKVAIMLGTSRDFFSSFMGTLLAGAVPVPLYPPFTMNRLEEYIARQAGIVKNAEASVFITLDNRRAIGEVLKTKAPALRAIVSVSDLVSRSRPIEPVLVDGTEPALIQYTSGSTGDPKGVLLSHENLLTNIRAIGHTLSIQPDDVGVSWLPLYHDMGLIGAWLTPLYFGIPVAIFSPLAFLARPERWLWTIHTRRGTISPAPNFAYELCARKIEQSDMEGLDLSSWRVALTGAEPVAPNTIDRFTRRFSAYGFDAESFLPVYGLAESSLLVAAPRRREKPRVVDFDRDALERDRVARRAVSGTRSLRLVSVGEAVLGHEVKIVDDGGAAVEDGVEGSVLFRGPSSMQGYYRNESATAAIRRNEGFLDSGDRGFRSEGDLFITGRSKDIIIRAGRNLMPQEIESEVAKVAGVRAGCVAAFGVADQDAGTESIVVVAEARESSHDAKARIRREIEATVLDASGSPPDDVVLIPPRTILKTPSGKIRRSACRERYLRGGHRRNAGRNKTSWMWWARAGYRWYITALARGWRQAKRLAFGSYVSAVSVLFVAAGWVLALVVPSRRFFQRFVHRAARAYLALTGIRLEVEGAARLDGRAGPFVFAVNHASYLDAIPVMAALSIDYAFVVKREAATWPVIGKFIQRLGHLPVERVHAGESAKSTRAMHGLLENGRSVVLFPEGTFTYASGIRPFKLGAFKLAVESEPPLVPVALVGTRRWLRDGTWIPRRSALKVVIGKPRTAREASFSGMVQLKEETVELIAHEVGERRLDLIAAGPVDANR